MCIVYKYYIHTSNPANKKKKNARGRVELCVAMRCTSRVDRARDVFVMSDYGAGFNRPLSLCVCYIVFIARGNRHHCLSNRSASLRNDRF